MAPFDLNALLGSNGSYAVYLLIGFAFGFVLESSGFGDARRLAERGRGSERRMPVGERTERGQRRQQRAGARPVPRSGSR